MEKMSDDERVTRLEERMNALDKTVSEIKLAQSEQAKAEKLSAMDYVELTGKLSTLTDNLKLHNEWHEKQGEKKYRLTDVVIAVCMLGLAIMTFYNDNKKVEVRYVNVNSQSELAQTEKGVNK
jgi:Zn-dependent metalloprotease